MQLHCQLIIYDSVHELCFDLQGSDPKKQKTEPVLVQRKGAVASAFNDEVHVVLVRVCCLNVSLFGYRYLAYHSRDLCGFVSFSE